MIPEKSITFAICTIGCKTNQAESDDIARQLVLRGCRQAEIPDAARAAAADAVGADAAADVVSAVGADAAADVVSAVGADAAADAVSAVGADAAADAFSTFGADDAAAVSAFGISPVAAGVTGAAMIAPDTAGATGAVGTATVSADTACAAGADSAVDYIIINTCTVTAAADRKVRHLTRKLKSASPKAKLIITGCFAELHREPANDVPADFIFSNSRKKEIADFICNTGCIKEEPGAEEMPAATAASTAEISGLPGPTARAGLETAYNTTAEPEAVMDPAGAAGQKAITGKSKEALKVTSAPVAAAEAVLTAESQHTHSRAFVKVQDGCRQGCTYCIVPLVRGPYLSTNPEIVINDIKNLVYHGHEEIVLTGIHIGKFGVDLLSKNDEIKTLPELIIAILKNTGIKRLRLSSIEINEIDESLIGVIRNNRQRIAPHLHIPLQSGSDKVLKAMNRKYDSGFFISAIEHIKRAVPGITLTTDVITGFPGETGQDFIDTVEMVKNIGFSKLHVFKYSIRPGTKAAGMSGQVQEKTKTERSRILRNLGLDLRKSFVASNINKKLDVVCEEYDSKSGIASGTSQNYLKVYFDLRLKEYKLTKGRILKVLAKSLYEDGLYGDL